MTPASRGSLEELANNAGFVRITSAGLREGHVHVVILTKEAPNCRLESTRFSDPVCHQNVPPYDTTSLPSAPGPIVFPILVPGGHLPC